MVDLNASTQRGDVVFPIDHFHVVDIGPRPVFLADRDQSSPRSLERGIVLSTRSPDRVVVRARDGLVT